MLLAFSAGRLQYVDIVPPSWTARPMRQPTVTGTRNSGSVGINAGNALPRGGSEDVMRFFRTLSVTVFIVCLASRANGGCAVDAVAAKSDTTISISWDLSGCNNVNNGDTFEICWKKASNSGDVCIPPTKLGQGITGVATISGLLPSTAYKLRTKWHRKQSWYVATNRTVTTDPSPASSGTVLRYEKGPGQPYCVQFYWQNPPPPNPQWKLALHIKHRFLWIWVTGSVEDLSTASFNSSTNEFHYEKCELSNNRRYRANIFKELPTGFSQGIVSNEIEWN
jgi:hypothetical protein